METIIQESTKTLHPVIEITNLSKGFDDMQVLKNLSLKLFDGENLVVLGKSGSGKSVLIKCIVRLLNSDQGTITVLGENVNKLKSRKIGSAEGKSWISFSKWCTVRFHDH